MNPDLDSIGSNLLQHSEKAQFSAAGALDRLFPFIYQASERMSSRAIAAWLAKEHNVQLGYTSIARALRHKERRLQEFAEEIEDAANAVRGEMGQTLEQVLTDEQVFQNNLEDHVAHGPKRETEGERARFSRMAAAFEILDSRWFVLSPDVRAEVMEFIQGERGLDEDDEALDGISEQHEEREEERP